jgi:uncharacterized protein YacL
MNKTLLPIRTAFLVICAGSGWLVCFTIQQWDAYLLRATLIGLLIGALVVLVDILLKGFSLRGLSAITFGIAVGMLVSLLLSISPLFEYASSTAPQTVYLFRLALFVVCSYLGIVIALRGKDEFNLVIPYVRFVPHDVDVPLVVVDTSALIDGRVAKICAAGFINAALVIPRFVLQELQRVADSTDPLRQARGRRGLDVLNDLRRIKNLDLRIHESEVSNRQEVDAKLVFLAQSLRAKLLTTDVNLAKMAEFHGVQWLNLNLLAQALRQELMVGDTIEVDLVKPGKEEGQAVGFVDDGSMVVVSAGRAHLGRHVSVAVTSVLPSAGGKMIFARLVDDAAP